MKNRLITILCFFSIMAFGQGESTGRVGTLPTDRPGATYNATTLQAGVWQLQSGVEWGGLISTGYGKGYDVIGTPIDLRYGITDRFEIMFSPKFNFATVQNTGGGIEYSLSSYSLLGRFSVFQGKPFGNMSVFGGYQYITYEGGIANANTGIFKVLYALPLTDWFQVSTNLGYSFIAETATDNTTNSIGGFDYTLNLAFALSPQFGIYIETYGFVAEGGSISWVDGGVYWLVNDDFQVDALFATGSGDSLQDYYSSLGISYRFGTPR